MDVQEVVASWLVQWHVPSKVDFGESTGMGSSTA